jgi:hypothetical protein
MNQLQPRPVARVVSSMLVAAVMTSAGVPAAAAGIDIRGGGPCSVDDVTWSIKATPKDGRIKVTFKVDAGVADQNWHLKLEHNRANLFKGHKITPDNGILVIKKVTEDSAGFDRFHLQGSTPGVFCEGSVTLEA